MTDRTPTADFLYHLIGQRAHLIAKMSNAHQRCGGLVATAEPDPGGNPGRRGGYAGEPYAVMPLVVYYRHVVE